MAHRAGLSQKEGLQQIEYQETPKRGKHKKGVVKFRLFDDEVQELKVREGAPSPGGTPTKTVALSTPGTPRRDGDQPQPQPETPSKDVDPESPKPPSEKADPPPGTPRKNGDPPPGTPKKNGDPQPGKDEPCPSRRFEPKMYPFKFPGRRDDEPAAERYSRMPPFWALLDHTLGVVWNLGARSQTGNSGIADLQWALEFLRGTRDKDGGYHKDVQGVIDAIQDQLIERYAAMGDDATRGQDDDVVSAKSARDISVTYSDMLARLPATDCPPACPAHEPPPARARSPPPPARPMGFLPTSEVIRFLQETAINLRSNIHSNQRAIDSIDRFVARVTAPTPGQVPLPGNPIVFGNLPERPARDQGSAGRDRSTPQQLVNLVTPPSSSPCSQAATTPGTSSPRTSWTPMTSSDVEDMLFNPLLQTPTRRSAHQ